MNSYPLVSVLVPAYNVETYLMRCIESIQKQTYPNVEIIIVDDSSPDNSGIIADKMAQKDPKITVVHHKKNLGYSGARNTCLDYASGEYITFVDSDDFVEPDYIEYLMYVMDETKSDISMSRNFFTTRLHDQVKVDKIATITPEDMLCDILYNRIHVGVWNRLYKRTLIKEQRFLLDAKTGEGMEFNTRIVPNATCVGVGLKRVYTYNVDNSSSATKKPNIDKQAYGGIATANIVVNALSKKGERVKRAAEYQWFSTALYALIHIMRANARAENCDFFHYLIRSIRKMAPKTLFMELSVPQKIKSIMAWISPTLTVRASVIWRYQLGHKQRV